MSSALSMLDAVTGDFQTVEVVVKTETGGGYVDGIYVDGTTVETTFPDVNIQPLTDNELDMIMRAEERVIDVRKLYITNGDLSLFELASDVYFLDQRWKIIRRDVRKFYEYAKIIVDRYDDQ